MSVRKRIIYYLSGVVVMLSLSACNGILGAIYDEPLSEEINEFGFISVDEKNCTGRIYIDATDYTEWHYICFSAKEVITMAVDDTPPAQWDLAIHRYDAKTNGGTVVETTVTDFSMVSHIGSIPKEQFVADEWTTNRITVDMSQMMDGVILYAEDYYNPCLSKWLHVDTSTMPPIYTLSGKIYLLRLSDGTCAALRLSNFVSDAAIKGFMTIDYLYPIEL